MNILIMGLPGSGKGTQSELIVKNFGVVHLSTGNLFREEMKNKTALGEELATYIDAGKLVPDELTVRLLKEEISKPKYEEGFLLDGFPRTFYQAQALEGMLASIQSRIDVVLYLDLDKEIIIERLSGRQFCPTCQKTYHKTLNPPTTPGVCDDDQTTLITREDDQPQKVKTRLDIANKEMQSMLDFYQAQRKLHIIKINEEDNVECVFKKIKEVLGHD